MKVALACPYAWDAPGGVRLHVEQLADHLRRRGHETLVLTPAWSAPSGAGVEVVGRPVRVPFNGSIAPICPDLRSVGRIRRALRTFGPDVVHAHEPFSPSTAMFATWAATVPVVATSHTYFERSALLAVATPVMRRVWERPAVWLAVSEANARFLRRHIHGEIRVVPNGADVDLFAGARPAEGLPGTRRALFVGRLEPRKGFEVAVRAFGILAERRPDLTLIVAGEGPSRTAVDAVLPSVRERIVMLGAVPHDDLPPYHAACDVSLSPATGRESFGLVLVEAMAAGTPIVASDIPGYREVVRDGIDGLLVPPNAPPALAAAVERILGDERLAARLREAGPARAERYRWDSVAAEIETAYRDAIAAGGSGESAERGGPGGA